MAKPLDSRPARRDLTNRECTILLGSFLGGLSEMAKPETVREACRWWADTDVAWQALCDKQALVDVSGSILRGHQ